MTDMLTTGITWLDTKRKAFMGKAAVYRRSGTDIAVAVTMAATAYESADESITVTANMQDFIISVADLATLTPVTPTAGDLIIVGAHTYEAMNLGAENCWRWTDGSHIAFRIHAKQVSDE